MKAMTSGPRSQRAFSSTGPSTLSTTSSGKVSPDLSLAIERDTSGSAGRTGTVHAAMRRGRSALALAVAAIALAFAAPARAVPIELGHIPECVELLPAAIALPPGEPATLRVRVLLDGVSQARGEEVFQLVRRSYAPLNVTVEPTFETVSFAGTDAEALNAQAKARFGGTRPAGTDVVYTLTDKDIVAAGSAAVAGLADCIGGIAFPSRAFSVGEVLDPDRTQLGELLIADHLTAKVAAHEIGHLLGAHHHYANCIEGLLSELGTELSPCTLMFNAVDLTSFPFSTLNTLVVRGHIEAYGG